MAKNTSETPATAGNTKIDILQAFDAARRVSVPVLVVTTSDQSATEQKLRATLDKGLPAFRWDIVRGLSPLNRPAAAIADKWLSGTKALPSINFVDMLITAIATMASPNKDAEPVPIFPRGTVIFAHNVQRHLQSQEPGAIAANVQGIANLIQEYKADHRTLVLLGPHVPVPLELDQDVVTLDDPLPARGELQEIVVGLFEAAKLAKPEAETLDKVVDALSGLSAFAAEQVTAMSLTPAGVDLGQVRERHRQSIERAPGLSVWRGGETFADLIGLDAIKAHLRNRARARTPIGVIGFVDEIDKVFPSDLGATTNDVKVDQFRGFLTEMENNRWKGLIAVGVPGAGKSAIAKAFGNEIGVPTIAIDLGAMESKWVGDSEANLRNFFRVMKAVGGGHAYIIATSNNATVMRPELQRRFTDGMWFFDLMTEPERLAAFKHFIAVYNLPPKQAAQLPDHDSWTASEIRNCCEYAWDTSCTLVEAARFIVPMAVSRADEIEKLRQYANGRFLDVSRGGDYRYNAKPLEKAVRAISFVAPGSKELN